MPRRPHHAFTLLELLVVVFILATVAASAISLVGQTDEQLRYETTRSRLESIRRAVLGRNDLSDPTRVAGFVADMGRLPASLDELFHAPPPSSPAPSDLGLDAGWRGPYLHALPNLSGELRFRDGWGNTSDADDALNHGWRVVVELIDPDAAAQPLVNPPATLWITSLGADRSLDDGPPAAPDYANDYPTEPLVVRDDHLIDLSEWHLTCQIQAASSATVRLQLLHVWDGEVVAATEFPSDEKEVSVGPNTIEFRFPEGPAWVAGGRVALQLLREDDEGEFQPSAVRHLDLYPRTALPLSLPGVWSLP